VNERAERIERRGDNIFTHNSPRPRLPLLGLLSEEVERLLEVGEPKTELALLEVA
jgi:hypothetical protein